MEDNLDGLVSKIILNLSSVKLNLQLTTPGKLVRIS